jgi:Putative phage abortive infection protein
MTSEATQAVKATKQPINWKLTTSTWGACACVVLGIAVAIPPLVVLCHTTGDKFTLNNLSSLGSYWQGSVASLFSLGAFLLIYATFLAEQKQIAQQDKELEDQKHQFQLQQESIKRQNFESSFFQLLGLHNELVAGMLHINGPRGRQCFSAYYSNFGDAREQWIRRRHQISTPFAVPLTPYNTKAEIIAYYDDYYREREANLGHYFRNLYHIIKFVKTSDEQNKRRYTSLVRAQLSKYELFFLFYNCLSSYGEGFKPLIEEFGLLEHLDKKLLLDPSHEHFYAASAFR